MKEHKFVKKHSFGGQYTDARFGVNWYNEWMKSIGNYQYKCSFCDYIGSSVEKHPNVSRTFVKNHIIENHLVMIVLKKNVCKQAPHLETLKPWEDKESLFCSPNLKYIIGKEPLSGKECKDTKTTVDT